MLICGPIETPDWKSGALVLGAFSTRLVCKTQGDAQGWYEIGPQAREIQLSGQFNLNPGRSFRQSVFCIVEQLTPRDLPADLDESIDFFLEKIARYMEVTGLVWSFALFFEQIAHLLEGAEAAPTISPVI